MPCRTMPGGAHGRRRLVVFFDQGAAGGQATRPERLGKGRCEDARLDHQQEVKAGDAGAPYPWEGRLRSLAGSLLLCESWTGSGAMPCIVPSVGLADWAHLAACRGKQCQRLLNTPAESAARSSKPGMQGCISAPSVGAAASLSGQCKLVSEPGCGLVREPVRPWAALGGPGAGLAARPGLRVAVHPADSDAVNAPTRTP